MSAEATDYNSKQIILSLHVNHRRHVMVFTGREAADVSLI